MNQELLALYNDELIQLRKQGAMFADAHPKIASRLKLGQGAVEDPLVGRLIESTAFLTAKMRYQLANDNASMDSDLLQLLYPHYFLPLPSCTTIQFSPSDKLTSCYTLANKTSLETAVDEHNNCYFTTCYPVPIRPISLTNSRYQREGYVAPKQHAPKVLKSCLSFSLSTLDDNLSLAKTSVDSIRVFINADLPDANILRELLLARTKEIIIVSGNTTTNIPLSSIQAVGFSNDDQLLPYLPTSFSGYRLLTEYFSYPEKFMYVDIIGLSDYLTDDIQSIDLHYYFDCYYADLTNKVNDNTLQLHTAPAINVFTQTGEPITFDHTQQQYHIIPDAQYETQNIEVYNIESLDISCLTYKNTIDCMPYFGRNATHLKTDYIYWHQKRQPCWTLGYDNVIGSEVFVTISDFNVNNIHDELILTPTLLCTNRDMASHIPFGGGKPEWCFKESDHELVVNMRCLRGITTARYRDNGHQRQQIAQHVYVNQIGLADDGATTNNIKLLLSHYQHGQPDNEHFIQQGIMSAHCEAITIRHPSTLQQGFCRGLDYQLLLDETYFADNDIYLFGSILHEFLTKSSSINGFVTLTINTKQRGKLFTWKPKLGTKPTL